MVLSAHKNNLFPNHRKKKFLCIMFVSIWDGGIMNGRNYENGTILFCSLDLLSWVEGRD